MVDGFPFMAILQCGCILVYTSTVDHGTCMVVLKNSCSSALGTDYCSAPLRQSQKLKEENLWSGRGHWNSNLSAACPHWTRHLHTRKAWALDILKRFKSNRRDRRYSSMLNHTPINLFPSSIWHVWLWSNHQFFRPSIPATSFRAVKVQ